MARIPQCLFNQIDAQDKDQCSYNHDSCDILVSKDSQCEDDKGGRTYVGNRAGSHIQKYGSSGCQHESGDACIPSNAIESVG